ncbi:Cobalamin biosynthesis protein CobD [Azospirillaceae bacterium]
MRRRKASQERLRDMPVLNPGDPGALLLLLAAWCVDVALGASWFFRKSWFCPAVLVARVVVGLDRRLNRVERGDANLMARGVLVVLVVLSAVAAFACAVTALARVVPYGFGFVLAVLIACVSLRRPWSQAREVRRALEQGGPAAGRHALSQMVGRPVSGGVDVHGVARQAIEETSLFFNRNVVGCVFWFGLAGLPGLMVWEAVGAMNAMIGARSPRYEHFGWAAAKLDALLNFLPARLTGLALALASSFVPGGRAGRAFRTMRRDARRHRSPNLGWPIAATAGGLGLALGGVRCEGEVTIHEPWIGDGRARVVGLDVGRVLALACIALLIVVCAAALVVAVVLAVSVWVAG